MQTQLGQDVQAQSDSIQEEITAGGSTQIHPKEIQPATIEVEQRHPKGSNARVLLASVFGPYAQDDEF